MLTEVNGFKVLLRLQMMHANITDTAK